MIMESDLEAKLKDWRKSWAKMDPASRTTAAEEFLGAVGSDPVKVMKSLELCPPLAESLSSAEGVFPRAVEEVTALFEKEVESRVVMAAMKVLVLSYSADKHPSHPPQHLQDLLIRVIEHADTSIEVALVAGTSLAKIVIKCCLQCAEETAEKWSEILDRLKDKAFSKACVVAGILNCGEPRILLGKASQQFVLFDKIFDHVIDACSTSSIQTYQNFQSFKIFTCRLMDLAGDLGGLDQDQSDFLVRNFACRAPKSLRMLRVAEANWENPLKGVTELVKESYSNILDVCRLLDEEGHGGFIEEMLEQNMTHMQWRNKAKYPALEILVLKVGSAKVLQRYPRFGEGLAHSLTCNHMASAGAAVYRAVLKHIDVRTWDAHFREELEKVLTADNSLVRSNAKDQWLPVSISAVPGASALLLESLNRTDSSGDHNRIAAALLVMKIDRQLGRRSDWNAQELAQIGRGLEHADASVRSAAFSTLCHYKKKGVPPTKTEMDMVLSFLKNNLIVDSPAFRQYLHSDFTILVLRCRDTLVLQLRKKALKEEEGLQLIKGLDDVMELLFRNCYPGANYQRLITCLDLLHLLNGCFFDYDRKGMNKGSGNGDPADLVAFCKGRGTFQLHTRPHFSVLISCMLYYMSDVREKAQELLVRFSPGAEEIKAVARHGFKLLCSPKFCDCESGSGFLRLVQHWTRKAGLALSQVLSLRHHSELLQGAVPSLESIDNLSEYLLCTYENLVDCSESQLLKMATECPMHGLLTALRFCLEHDRGQVRAGFLRRLVLRLEKTVDLMLRKLGQEDRGGAFNASFAEMSNAIESLLSNGEDGGKEEDSVEIKEEHQLILACTWLNIKECSMLSAHLVSVCDLSDDESFIALSVSDAEKCGNILKTVVTKCRHKGAIEAANSAVRDFATRLLGCGNEKFSRIPEEMLSTVLDQVEHFNASITRRSAGLPMFVQKIVASEPRGKTRRLLALAVRRLVLIAGGESSRVEVETEDNAQSHALHILRSVVHDGVLGCEISHHLSSILVCCVDRFSSPYWSVRNAALQLFGSIVPRILGQKKVREEGSPQNTLTVTEFLARYADIVPYLLERLMMQEEATSIVSSFLVPLLSMLSRISPGIVEETQQHGFVLSFKRAFFRHLRSCVINVRQLAATAFASFTPTHLLVQEMEEVSSKLRKVPTNLQNGLLLCLKELLKQTLSRDCAGNEQEVGLIIGSLSEMQKDLCCANLLVLQDLYTLARLPSVVKLDDSNLPKTYEPSYYELCKRLKLASSDNDDGSSSFKTRSEGMAVIERMQHSPLKVISFLGDSLDNPAMNGAMIEKCNEVIHRQQSQLSDEAEAALELLDASSDERIVGGAFGVTAKTSSLPSSAVAFSVMMLQDDYEMFFRDESPYVSQFVELAERILAFSGPENVETSRLHSVAALRNLVPIFNGREVAKLPLLMQYGFVHAMNSALTLVMDEDPEIREEVTRFACSLKLTDPWREDLDGRDLCTPLAIKKLVLYGLEHFRECWEWFQPVLDVFYLPWREKGVETLRTSMCRQSLFESGEGVNVYAERITMAIAFADTIKEWLVVSKEQKEDAGLKLALDVTCVVKEAEATLDFCDELFGREGLSPLSIRWTPVGYLVLTRFYNLLLLIKDFNVTSVIPSKENFADMELLIGRIKTHIMHL